MEAITANFKDPEAGLDELFQELEGAYKIQVLRIEPEWCKGTLGTFDFMPGETVSTDWLVERFGGRKLQVKILHQDSSYNVARTVVFPEAPRKDGIQIVQGPEGSPISVHERDANKETTPPPQQDNGMSGLFQKMLEMQTAQSNQMQSLMMTLLSKTLDAKSAPVPAPAEQTQVHHDPQSQLRQTLETVQAIEELKGVMGGGGEALDIDGEPENPIYNSIIEKLVDKFTAEPSPKQHPQQQIPPQRHLPPGPIARDPSNLELAMMVKDRLKTLPDDQREMLLSHVLEDEEEETPTIAGQDDLDDLDSLLTKEDRETLGDESNPENESEAI